MRALPTLLTVLALVVLAAACAEEAADEEAPDAEAADDELEDDADEDHEHDDAAVEAFEVLDRDEDEEVVASVHDDHWDGDLPEIAEGDNLSLGARIVDADGEEVALDGEDHALGVDLADDALAGVVELDEHGDHVHVTAESEDTTEIVLQWLEEGEVAYETPPLPVTVDFTAQAYTGGREVLDPEPRLAIADGDEATLDIHDLIEEESLAALDLAEPDPILEASGPLGQVLVASQPDADAAHVIDVATWALEHGDHAHYYIDEPRELAALDLDTPIHTTYGHQHVGVFADGEGTAVLIDEQASLEAGEAVTEEIATAAPHHGAVVPLGGDRAIVSEVDADHEEGLPETVALVEGDEQVETHDCPGLHGDTVTATGAALACEDGILALEAHDDHLHATEIAYPDEVDRLGYLAGHPDHDHVAATDGGDQLVIADTADGEIVAVVELPAEAATGAHVDDDGSLLVVTDDGVVHQVDLDTGELIASSDETLALDDDGPEPGIAGGRDRAYVSSPGDGRILELATNDDLRLARELDVGGTPAGLAYFGAMW